MDEQSDFGMEFPVTNTHLYSEMVSLSFMITGYFCLFVYTDVIQYTVHEKSMTQQVKSAVGMFQLWQRLEVKHLPFDSSSILFLKWTLTCQSLTLSNLNTSHVVRGLGPFDSSETTIHFLRWCVRTYKILE